MFLEKNNIIHELQKWILPLQGFKNVRNEGLINVGHDVFNISFPNKIFPIGAVHEFLCADSESIASSSGFISGIISPLMKQGGVSVWISTGRTPFPPALQPFGINLEKVIFIYLQKQKDISWVFEEALKCEGLVSVIGEVTNLDFYQSRRFQLAVEKSNVTGFVLRRNVKQLSTTACVSRWKISSIPSGLEDEMPGVGFPGWRVELLKVRNGKPGVWDIQWKNGKLEEIKKAAEETYTVRKEAV